MDYILPQLGIQQAHAARDIRHQSHDSSSHRLGENDAWIAATALSYGATLVARDTAFARVPRLDYLKF